MTDEPIINLDVSVSDAAAARTLDRLVANEPRNGLRLVDPDSTV